jgi:hypothetical protein
MSIAAATLRSFTGSSKYALTSAPVLQLLWLSGTAAAKIPRHFCRQM